MIVILFYILKFYILTFQISLHKKNNDNSMIRLESIRIITDFCQETCYFIAFQNSNTTNIYQ